MKQINEKKGVYNQTGAFMDQNKHSAWHTETSYGRSHKKTLIDCNREKNTNIKMMLVQMGRPCLFIIAVHDTSIIYAVHEIYIICALYDISIICAVRDISITCAV